MRFSLLFILFLLTTVTAFAQHRDEFGIQTDNDSYLANGSDRYYTNGTFFYFNRALKLNRDSTHLANKVLGFELGQKMYNSQAGQIPTADYDDRPFAGYLYAGVTLNLLYKDESSIKLSGQLGAVGPASLADVTQEWIHNTFGLYKIDGWQFQIKNDFEVNLGMEYNRLLFRDAIFDASLASYAHLGTGFTGAGVGPMLRLGNFNQLFHSQITHSNVTADGDLKPLHKHELFLYYKPQINYVAYDATIEGGLFQTHAPQLDYDPSLTGEVVRTPEPFVLSQQVGGVYSTNRWVFDVSATFDTQDVKYMIIHAHQWGTIEVLYRFN